MVVKIETNRYLHMKVFLLAEGYDVNQRLVGDGRKVIGYLRGNLFWDTTVDFVGKVSEICEKAGIDVVICEIDHFELYGSYCDRFHRPYHNVSYRNTLFNQYRDFKCSKCGNFESHEAIDETGIGG